MVCRKSSLVSTCLLLHHLNFYLHQSMTTPVARMGKSEWFGRILKPFKQWFRVHVTPHLPGGWRTAALVNTILIAIVSVLMAVFSAVALIQAGGFNRPLVLFTGACGIGGASALNAVLHIIINILSTAMLASSNMFMQVLNAPSRKEVDKSHARGSWLEIGVLSGRNIFRLSPFKTIAWLGFLISSIPVHLLFNSAIFQSSYRFSRYDLAIASEPFLHGGKYLTPGASLLNSGGLTIYEAKRSVSTWSPDVWDGYGDFVNLTEYQDDTSAINMKIASAARSGSSWTRINKKDCKQEYLACSGLSTHRDVIIVVSDTQGWPRSEVWNLNEEQSSFWDAYVPDDASEPEHNSLWFYSECAMSAYSGDGQTNCGNSCRWALGGQNATGDWMVPFYPINSTTERSVLNSGDNGYADWNNPSIYYPEQNKLNVAYCLVQPAQASCKVAMSTTLLVCVTGCAFLKMILCTWVYCRLRPQNPLTTPGDAINSFISEPDPHTAGMSLLSQGEIRMGSFCGAPQPGPRKYRQRKRNLGITVPSSEWFLLLVIMASALVGAVALIGIIGIGAGGI